MKKTIYEIAAAANCSPQEVEAAARHWQGEKSNLAKLKRDELAAKVDQLRGETEWLGLMIQNYKSSKQWSRIRWWQPKRDWVSNLFTFKKK